MIDLSVMENSWPGKSNLTSAVALKRGSVALRIGIILVQQLRGQPDDLAKMLSILTEDLLHYTLYHERNVCII